MATKKSKARKPAPKKKLPTRAEAKTRRDRIKDSIKPVDIREVASRLDPKSTFETVAQRIEHVRKAVAEAFTGATDEEYNKLLEELLADAEGWKGDLENRKAEAADAAPTTEDNYGAAPVEDLRPAAAGPDEEE